MRKFALIATVCIAILLVSWTFFSENSAQQEESYREWAEYQGGPGRNQYSSLAQIDTSNVHELEMAWQYKTKDTGQIQSNPIVVDGVLYSMTATTQPFAVNAATGEEIWRKATQGMDKFSTSRGLVYWEKEDDKRILYTNGEWLIALDARTGDAISSFGTKGRTSLKSGLGSTVADKMVISNAPGTVFDNLIIMPLRVSEGTDAAPGHIQAFNIETGELEWVFKTIPHPGEAGYETWPEEAYKNHGVGGGNNWAGMAVDREREIVYIPTGSAAYDFYGGNRKGDNLFTNSLVALNARTGELIWHYQLVHHDILDRDPPAAPNLITVDHNGEKVDAVAQVTKQGLTFLFDRETGETLFPIEERPVPLSDIPGEHSSPTQPFPVKPAPFARQELTENDISPYAENKEELKEIIRQSRNEGPFTPLSEQGSIVYPGLDGGAEWGGAAADPDGILYVNSSEMAWHIGLGPTASDEELEDLSTGQRLYQINCAACHGGDLRGNPESGFPSLYDLDEKRTREEVVNTITTGKGMMPSFGSFSETEMQALVSHILNEEGSSEALKEPGMDGGEDTTIEMPYTINLFGKFLDSNGYPGIKPPWGTLNAIDMNTGEYVWKIPYGEYPDLMEQGHPITGSESYGGPAVTAGGLLFIAGTKDKKFRAYNKKTGELLWETVLPAAAFATPAVYEVDGKQYVAIACGGTKLGAEGGDSYVAFALPDHLLEK